MIDYEAMRMRAEALTVDEARKVMKKIGILDEKGHLTERYGGEPVKVGCTQAEAFDLLFGDSLDPIGSKAIAKRLSKRYMVDSHQDTQRQIRFWFKDGSSYAYNGHTNGVSPPGCTFFCTSEEECDCGGS